MSYLKNNFKGIFIIWKNEGDSQMAEDNTVKVEVEQDVQATEPEGGVVDKALYYEEIQGRKKERKKRQGLEAELDKIKSKAEEERQLKMIAEGKKDDVISEQAEKLKKYEARLSEYDKQESAQREVLLESIPEDERVHYEKMDLIQLQHFVGKDQAASATNPPQAVQGRSNVNLDLDSFMDQSVGKQRSSYKDLVNQYAAKSRNKA